MIDDQLRRAIARGIEDEEFTARGLATRAGVPASAVVRFLGEKRDIQLGTAARICDALGLGLGAAARKPAVKAKSKGPAGKTAGGMKG